MVGDHKFKITIKPFLWFSPDTPLEREKHKKLSIANVQTCILILIYLLRWTEQRSFKINIMGMLLTKINFAEKTARGKFNILIYTICLS